MEFAEIFTEMNVVPAVLLCVGFVFIAVEVFVPGFGFFGILGLGSTIAGIVVRIIDGLDITQTLVLILLVLGILVVAGLIMVYSAQYGILGHTGLFENNSTLSYNYNKVPKELKKLIGKSGRAKTDLSLAGKAKIKGELYDVVSMNSFIPSGAHVKVVDIKDGSIVVRKWFE